MKASTKKALVVWLPVTLVIFGIPTGFAMMRVWIVPDVYYLTMWVAWLPILGATAATVSIKFWREATWPGLTFVLFPMMGFYVVTTAVAGWVALAAIRYGFFVISRHGPSGEGDGMAMLATASPFWVLIFAPFWLAASVAIGGGYSFLLYRKTKARERAPANPGVGGGPAE